MIQDAFLTEMAKALNKESYVTPSYLAFGTTTYSPLSTDTVLPGETGDVRIALTYTRANTADVTFVGTRTGASVTQNTGLLLYGAAYFNALLVGTLLTSASLPGLLHTSAYDIEIDSTYTFNRG